MTKTDSVKVYPKFYADGNEWTVVERDASEGVYIQSTSKSRTFLINICTPDNVVYVYRVFKNGNTRGIDWLFSFEEIKMLNEIIKRIEDNRL